MVEALGRCMICGTPITAPFCVCASCEREYELGGPAETWPAWARELRSGWDHQRWLEQGDLDNLDDSAEAAALYDRLCYGDGD